MTVYTQPALDLAPTTWADVFAALDKAGVRFTRTPDAWRSSMESYSAAWWGSKYNEDGSYVHIHVYLYRRVMACRWQIDARRMDTTGEKGPRGLPVHREGHRVLLHDPTPAQAIAALGVLGAADTVPAQWADVTGAFTTAGIALTRQPAPGLTADYRREWRGETPQFEALAYLRGRGQWVMIVRHTRQGVERPVTDHQVVLYGPSPAESMAALAAVGLDSYGSGVDRG